MATRKSTATNKTQATDADVNEFLATVEPERKREDCRRVVALMQEATGVAPRLWGSIIGFDEYHYRYDSGREGDLFIVGVAPRKSALTLYIMNGFGGYAKLMENLGKYKTGKSCLYINKLADVDEDVLRELIAGSVDYMRQKYPQAPLPS